MTPTNTLFFGPGGVGKTITATLLAVGIAKERHNGAGVTLVDTENIAEFVKPICAAEGVPLFIEPSRSFIDMRDALPRAVERNCCAFIVDHYDGVHRELSEAQKVALNLQGKLRPYHHREELMRLWDEWVILYRAAPIHAIFTARQAWDWGDDETDEGDPIKVKLGTKARGDADANYEPNLLIEMEKIDNFTRDKSRRKVGQIQHVARVVKDRRMVLNGLSFAWNDLNGYPKAGGYKAVWKALAPHFTVDPRVGPGGILRPEGAPRASTGLFSGQHGESAFTERAKRIAKAWGEVEGTINTLWPGQTTEEKRLKLIVRKMLFGVRSDAAIQALLPEQLETAELVMRHFEEAASDEQQKVNVRVESQVIDLLTSCLQLEKTRLEAMSF